MENVRICLLNDSFPPAIDGVANAVVNYARLISQNWGQAIVGTPQYPGAADSYPFPVVRYPSFDTTRLVGYRAGYPFSPRAIEALEDFQPDLIHSHCPVVSNLLARTLRERRDVPIVFTYHTKFDIDIAHAVEGRLLQAAAIRLLVRNIEASDEVWVVSRGAGENLRSLGYQGDYVVMENGVDFPRGPAPEEETAALRAGLGIAPGIPVYLFVGRMMWYKGIRLILEALQRCRAAGGRFRMLFIGEGAEREEMEALSRSLGLADCCLFLGAERDRARLRAYFSLADLFLFPSTFDTNGIVVREAAACALPSVLIRGSCAAEGTLDGQNALHMEESAGSLAQLLQRIGSDRPALRRLGRRALEDLYVSWEDSVRRACERYQAVIANYRRGVTDRSFEWSDEIFSLMGELCEGIEAARELRRTGGRGRAPL